MYFSSFIPYRKGKWIVLTLSFVLVLCARHFLKQLQTNVGQLTELHKCPACFGQSLCDSMTDNKISITYESWYTSFANILGTKNVLFGRYNGQMVVLKKLARAFELQSFDNMICTDPNWIHLCSERTLNTETLSKKIDYLRYVAREVTSDFHDENISSLRLCPNTDRMNDLFQRYYGNNANNRRDIMLAYLWTTVKINPEPLVLQILPAENGWPVPKYLGACGRLIVEEYVGPPLSNFYGEPWIRRAKIASSLLAAARMFTYRSEDFGFYLTDISPDNIAIDEHDEAKFIDMENIIVVDKRIPLENRSAKWDEIEVNEADFNCVDCLIFSPMDICARRYSDHNYYTVCQLLAPKRSSNSFYEGLLHDVPEIILERYPSLPSLVADCVSSRTRISAGNALREALTSIVREHVRKNI